jgi:tetratricopeptide (TPR) repeat protein
MAFVRSGDVIAERFVLEAEAGSGGMGTVFRARDRTSNALVALKLIHDEAGGERFDREVAALADLTHDAIVRYIAHGHVDGTRYLVMEWLEGEDLETRLSRGRLGEDETLELGGRLARALGAAHARGVVHRDLKPGNVRLCGGDIARCKLVDFGIARVATARALTRAGEIIGTPAFMAPEQVRGELVIGPSADVFSLGCLLYECLEGRPAFSGAQVMAILTKVLFDEPPKIAGPLGDIVARMMSKNAADRPPDGNAAYELLSSAPPSIATSARSFGDASLELVAVIVTGDPALETSSTLRAADIAHVESLIGGGRVAVIKEAVASDLAKRAVRTALSLGPGPVVVATGRAMVGRLPVGEVIDRAVRLLGEEKERGHRAGVRLDDTTASLAGSRFELTLIGGALHASHERADEPVRTLLGRVPPCVGRDRETALLLNLHRDCTTESKATCAIVTGSAGAGKSRLLSEFLARLSGAEVWLARGDPMGAGSTFALVGQMLRRTAGIALGEPASQARMKMLARAGRTTQNEDPEKESRRRIAEFLGEMAGVPFPAEDGSLLFHARLDGQRMSDQMLGAWLDFVESEARAQPLVIVLEDLHWGDATTVRFCDAALRVCRDLPLMVLALGRPELHDAFPNLFQRGNPHSLALAPLGKRACEAFVRGVLPDASDPIVATIVDQAQGHPLLLEELVRARIDGRESETPESVMAILQARLALLPEPARRMLRAASVFGTSFWASAVRGLVGETESKKWLDHLVERDVIGHRTRSRFEGETELAFRHALVRDAAYLTLVDEDRARGHKHAGEWLEARGEHDAASLGEHFEKGREPSRAIAWYHRAAEHAYEGGSFDEVIAFSNKVIALDVSGEPLGELKLVQAWSHYWRGQRIEQVARAHEALEHLPARTPLFFDALGVLGAGQARANDIEAAVETARRLLAHRDMSPACGSNAAWMANALRTFMRSAETNALFDLAQAVFAEHPTNQPLAARIHYARAVAAKFRGDLGTALDETRATCTVWAAVGDRKQLSIASLNLGDALMQVGRYEEAEKTLRSVVDSAARLGLLNMTVTAELNLGFVLARSGRAALGREMLERVVPDYERRGDRFLARVARTYLADVLRRLGDLDAAEIHARHVLDGPADEAPGVQARATLAQVLSARGAHAEALETILPAIEILNRTGIEEGEAKVRLAHIVALLGIGDDRAARDAVGAARARILEEAEKISDASLRRSFLEDVDEHARILAFEHP